MTYYPLNVIFGSKSYYLLWYSNDVDGVLVGSDGFIVTFPNVAHAEQYLETKGLFRGHGPLKTHDLTWIVESPFADIDPERTLESWNFLANVAASVPERSADFLALDRKPSRTYDKVFWGNNLPAVTPDGESYTPEFEAAERSEMQAILTSGIQVFLAALPSRQTA